MKDTQKIKREMKFQIQTAPERAKIWLETINNQYRKGELTRDVFEELYDECIKLMNTNPSTLPKGKAT